MKLNKLKLKTTDIFTFGEDENYKNYKIDEVIALIKKQAKKIDDAQKVHQSRGEPLTFGELWATDAIIKLLDCIEK